MKKLLTILLLICVHFSYATTYYVSAGGDNTTGLTAAHAWQTIVKLNSSMGSINAGDSILFNRGETFYGSIVMTRSGAAGNVISIDCYGSGAAPIITGLQTLSTWVNDGAGIWHSNVATADTSLRVILINGNLQQIGRFPNGNAANNGYLANTVSDTFTVGKAVVPSALSTTTNWTGATAAVRMRNWKIDRCRITSHSGSTIKFDFPYDAIYGDVDKFGAGYALFFENDIRTLDQFGEWYFNPSTNNLSIFFGANVPSSYNIQAAPLDTLLNLGGNLSRSTQNYITIKNLDFEGASVAAIYGLSNNTITVSNCTINNCYNGVFLNNGSTNAGILSSTITNIVNDGVWTSGTGVTLSNNYVKNIGLFPGMGASGDGAYLGLSQAGNNGSIRFNRIDSVGYIPIVFGDNNTSVLNNFVSNYANVKDDAGGIYTGNGFSNTSQTGREVANNIVINGIGASYSNAVQNEVNGIYIDAHSYGVYVHDNTVINMPTGCGLFLHVATNVIASSNTFYNVLYGVEMEKLSSTQFNANIIYTKNIVYPTTAGQTFNYLDILLGIPTATITNSDTLTSNLRATFTRIDSNYYRNDITNQFVFDARKYWNQGLRDTLATPANLARWQYITNQEAHSTPLSTATNNIYYNASSSVSNLTFSNYQKKDIYGLTYNDNTTLANYSSKVLFDNGFSPVNITMGSNISSPLTSATLSGSSTNSNVTYAWTQVSGANTAIFSNTSATNPTVSGMIVGTYVFRLTATTNVGSSNNSTQQVAVLVSTPSNYLLRHRYKH